MGLFRKRVFVVFFCLTVLPAVVGVVAVHASPACERYVHTYVTVPIRNRVSKATAAGWAKWRVGHPNWKPNPAVKRPRYVMTKQEAMHKVAFACDVPATPATPDLLLTGGDVPPPIIDLTPAFLDESLDTVPAGAPPVFARNVPAGDSPFFFPPGIAVPPIFGGASTGVSGPVTVTPGAPIVPVLPPDVPVVPVPPPVTTPVGPIAITPEPASIFLLALGMGSVAWMLRRRSLGVAPRGENSGR